MPTEAVGPGSLLDLAIADGGGDDAAAGLDDFLLEVAALGAGIGFVDEHAFDGRFGNRQPAAVSHRFVRTQEQRNLGIDRYCERVAFDGRPVAAA